MNGGDFWKGGTGSYESFSKVRYGLDIVMTLKPYNTAARQNMYFCFYRDILHEPGEPMKSSKVL